MEAFLLGPHPYNEGRRVSWLFNKDPVSISDVNGFNLITWWEGSREDYPSLSQYALDVLAIPATATECERAFSSTEELITPERTPGRGHY